MNSLRPEQAPDLCARLSALYTFMYKSLVEASSTRETKLVDEVIALLRFERETWQMCLESLARENKSATGMTNLPSERPPAADGNRATLSLRG